MSILDNTTAMNMRHHECGGTILWGNDHFYCDTCGAYSYDEDEPFPTGTDVQANEDAYDSGEDRSPDDDA